MAYQPTRPFRPQATGGASLAVSNSTGSVAIPGSAPTHVRLHTKTTDADCFIEFGTSGVVAATATGMVFGYGSTEYIPVPLNATHIAAITASGTATLYVHAGEGA